MNASEPWEPTGTGVLTFPSGRTVRGRGLHRPKAAPRPDAAPSRENRADPDPDFGLYLLGREPTGFAWTSRWLCWPDFRLPRDRGEAIEAITEAWRRAEHQRVEVACGGGHGRTGTVLSCMAVLEGMQPDEAISYVRAHYDPHAVETPWQRRFVRRFPQAG